MIKFARSGRTWQGIIAAASESTPFSGLHDVSIIAFSIDISPLHWNGSLRRESYLASKAASSFHCSRRISSRSSHASGPPITTLRSPCTLAPFTRAAVRGCLISARVRNTSVRSWVDIGCGRALSTSGSSSAQMVAVFPVLRQQDSASGATTDIAWFAPCPKCGLVGCAASPISTLLPSYH